MNKYTIGQTWVSDTEPELGVCRIVNIESKRVNVQFPATNETRIYSTENAPLKRVIFQVGDSVSDKKGNLFVVHKITKKNGLVYYSDGKNEHIESSIVATVNFSDATSRMRMMEFDSLEQFDLRYKTLQLQAKIKQSRVRGLMGARMELIPHQLYVVNQIASAASQRVLLSDEVGLGKTIEACLLIHRMLLTGQISRVLIIVPDPLVHQWFVELYTRFNLVFDILDQERFDTFEQRSSLLICGIDFLTSNHSCSNQIAEAGWDIMVVDEAHHLEWSPEKGGDSGYVLIKTLSESIQKVILLSATPEQLGIEGHFARLRLLDPNRYYDLKAFIDEQKHYSKAAKLADKIINNKPLKDSEQKLFSLPSSESIDSNSILKSLLDQYGTGRAIFRNTRHITKAFPKRIAKLVEIDEPKDSSFLDYLRKEFEIEKNGEINELDYDYTSDTRIAWLAHLLKKLKNEKIVLICHSKQKVMAIKNAILKIENFKIALFHEEMSVVNRDRDAAWFSQKDGARILLCSEIGSEGRNFQFAHHLVLYDLPLNPGLLEQRIGRLDRIGQENDIYIHIPYIKNSPQEVLARWYHEGLKMIENHLSGGHQFIKPFTNKIMDLAIHPHKCCEINELIKKSLKFRNNLMKKLEKGRDHLLELNSYDSKIALSLVDDIQAFDQDNSLEKYCLEAFDQFRIGVEPMSKRSYLLSPSHALMSLPWLKNEDVIVTCCRQKALEREDISFLTWDHPLTIGLIDAIINSTFGNCTFTIMESDTPQILLEAVFIIECQAPTDLHIDRFMPSIPIRVLVNHSLEDLTSSLPFKKLRTMISIGKKHILEENPMIINKLLPDLIKKGDKIAEEKGVEIIKKSVNLANRELKGEISRLIPLQKVNPNISIEDIEALKARKDKLIGHLNKAKTRLDSICLVLGK